MRSCEKSNLRSDVKFERINPKLRIIFKYYEILFSLGTWFFLERLIFTKEAKLGFGEPDFQKTSNWKKMNQNNYVHVDNESAIMF